MPQEKIIINFKAVGAENLTRAIRRLDDATRELQNKAKRYGKTSPFSPTNSRLQTNALATIRSKLLLLNFAMAMGIRQTIEYVKQAAKVEQMANAFNTLSGGVENATVALEKLKQATNGTMSEFDLFQQANNAMILGVSRNSDEMAEMFDIAQRLGRALGRDTKSSVESLITGIGRQSRLMLDNIGIMVNTEGAYKAFASTIGVNVDMLTDMQKKQAFLNITMDAAREKAGRLGDELINTQDAIEKVAAGWEDATVELGKFSVGLFDLDVRLPEIANHLKALNKILKGQELTLFDTNSMWINFAQGIETWLDPLGIWTRLFGSAADNLRDVNAQLLLFSSIPSPMAKWAEEAKDEDIPFPFLIPSEKDINEMTEGWIQVQQLLSKMYKDRKDSADKVTSELKIAELGINSISSALAGAAINGKHMGDAVVQALEKIAIQLVSKMAVYTLMAAIFPGAGLATGKGSALKFALGIAHGGGLIKDDGKVQRFATGGSVRGGDNVPILAQGGEFVMSRSAVQSVGIENLNRMNEGGGSSAVTVNVSGNVLSQDFVEGELAENIKEAIRRGTDFGIS